MATPAPSPRPILRAGKRGASNDPASPAPAGRGARGGPPRASGPGRPAGGTRPGTPPRNVYVAGMPRQPAEPDRHGRPDAGRDGRRADAPRPGDAPAGRFAQDRRGFDGRGRGDAPPRMDRPGRPAPGAEASHGRFRAEDARRGQPDPRAEGRRPPEDRRAGWGERPTRGGARTPGPGRAPLAP
jgi:hypothetical protein